jgi:hypothetical protein
VVFHKNGALGLLSHDTHGSSTAARCKPTGLTCFQACCSPNSLPVAMLLRSSCQTPCTPLKPHFLSMKPC